MQYKRFARGLMVLGIVLLLAAPGMALAQEGPKIAITEPADGATVGANVTLVWNSEGVKIVKAADAQELTEGHYHVFVDTEAITGADQVIPAGNPQIIHTGANTVELKDLTPGEHNVTIVLGYSNHTPWQPPVTAHVKFVVAATTLPATGGNPTLLYGLLALAGIALFGAGALMYQKQSH